MTDSCPPRFTDDEVLAIADLITERFDLGLWSRPVRETGHTFDRVTVWLIGAPDCHYRIERDAMQMTHLVWSTPQEERLVTSGDLKDCLSLFRRL